MRRRPRRVPFDTILAPGPTGRGRRVWRSDFEERKPPLQENRPDSLERRVFDIDAAPVVAVLFDKGAQVSRTARAVFAAGLALAEKRRAPFWVIIDTHFVAALNPYGVDGVIRSDALGVALFESAVKMFSPSHFVFPGEADASHDARALAARLNLPIAADVVAFERGELIALSAEGTRIGAPPPLIIVHKSFGGAARAYHGEAQPIAFTINSSSPQLVNFAPPQSDNCEIALLDAEVVVSGGGGVMNWAGLAEVARRINAALGASRVAVDAKRAPRGAQVGASGSLVDARVYLAFGISGAAQHFEGLKSVEALLAVNIDPACQMMQRAHLSIIGDADAIVVALVERLKASHA